MRDHYIWILAWTLRKAVRLACVQTQGQFSLRASSPIWASEVSLARTRERAAKPRGARERGACNHPLPTCAGHDS